MKMRKRKAAIQGILCAVWLILNWFRPGLLSAGVLCAVLTAQIVMQDFIEERRSLSLKKGWRAGAAFAAGAILTTIMILLPSKIEAGQALLSVGNALAFGLAGTLCIAVLFLEDTSKKQKAAGCVIFAVMLALCTALMRTSQGKNALSLAFMQKDTVFAPRMSTLYGLVVLPCLQAVLIFGICLPSQREKTEGPSGLRLALPQRSGWGLLCRLLSSVFHRRRESCRREARFGSGRDCLHCRWSCSLRRYGWREAGKRKNPREIPLSEGIRIDKQADCLYTL